LAGDLVVLPDPGGMNQKFRRAELDGMTGGGLVLEPNLDRFAARLFCGSFLHEREGILWDGPPLLLAM
jgi:hypothetical protein